jgi:AcrR family transcriptional regulator
MSMSARPRSYRSPLRERQAADTRRRISTAAMELFAEHGFAATTVAAIAERAGVSVPTIYAAFGSKGAILTALMTRFEEDADVTDWRSRVAAEPDPRAKLTAFARWSARLFSTSRAVILAAGGAATDPAMLALKAEGDRRRRAGMRDLVAILADAGALKPGLSRRRAVDRAWALTGLELYLATTVECGWSDAAYAGWLAELLIDQLLDRDHVPTRSG